MDNLLTVQQTAKKLNITERTVWNWIKSGLLKPTRINPGKVKSGKTLIEIDQVTRILRGE